MPSFPPVPNGGTITDPLVISGIPNATSLSITGATHTGADAHSDLSIASTWNTTGVITAFKLNVANTASGEGSLLMDLRVGGTTAFNVGVNGVTSLTSTYGNGYILVLNNAFGTNLALGINGNGDLFLDNCQQLWFNLGNAAIRFGSGGNPDGQLQWNQAGNGTLSLLTYNNTGGSVFGVNNLGTGDVYTNYEMCQISWQRTSNVATLQTVASGTGVLRGLNICGATTDLLGFYGTTAIVQPSTTGTTTGYTANTSANILYNESTFTGGSGSTAYRVSDVVKALKALGLIAA